jgi:hypothetical protein
MSNAKPERVANCIGRVGCVQLATRPIRTPGPVIPAYLRDSPVALPLAVIFCLCAVFCLAPLMLYLAWLGRVNRRARPTIISSGWDFAALLAGLSGFLVFGGGVLVAAVQSNFRCVVRGNWEQIAATWGQERLAWAAVALGYLLLLSGGVLLIVLSRARSLTVYNIDRDQTETVVGDVLAGLGLNVARFGDLWSENGRGLVLIDWFPGFRNATLKVVCPDSQLAEEIERGLRERLPGAPAAAANPAAAWLYSQAIACAAVVGCSILLIAYYLYLTRR